VNYQPTDEQITHLGLDLVHLEELEGERSVYWLAAPLASSDAFQAIIRAAQADAWEAGAKWGAVETGFMTERDVAHAWLVDDDNPYRESADV
jgi:hypothetical protein